MARRARRRARGRRAGSRAFPHRGADRQGAPVRRVPAVLGQHRVHQHDPGGEAGQAPRRLQHRAEDPPLRALECDGDGAPREQGHQRRRPHRELRVGGDALRHRLQSLLARAFRRARRRPRLRAGPLGARRLRAGVHARAAHRRADRQLPAGGRRQGHLVVPAPVADARFLAVPDGVDGTRPADGDLPGALHEVPARPRSRDRPKDARSGPSWATARWTSRSRWARSGMAARENLDNLVFVVNCNLQRLDGPVRGNGKIIQELESRLPRLRLERDQGHLGPALGSALRPRQEGRPDAPDDGGGRRRVPDDQVEGRRLRPRAFLQHAGAEGARRRLLRRGHLEAQPRRPRPVQGLQRVPRGREPQGPADGDPRQDDQGLRDGRVRRGAEHHAPAEEDVARVHPALSRSLRHSGGGRQARRGALRVVSGRLARARVHARAARRSRRLPAGAADRSRPRWSRPSSPRSTGS